MKTIDIELTSIEEDDSVQELRCPVCGKAWYTYVDGEHNGEDIAPCKHLKFQWASDWGCSFGKYNASKLNEAYQKAFYKVNEQVLLVKVGSDVMDDGYAYDVIEEMEEIPGLELHAYTETGMCCGPVSYTILYGVVRPAKKVMKKDTEEKCSHHCHCRGG